MVYSKKALSLTQVAAVCGVSYRKVARWVRRGMLPVSDFRAGQYVVSQCTLSDFLRSRGEALPVAISEGEHPRALIVEDDLAMAHAIERTLMRLGFETKILASGIDASLAIGEFRPILVTLDLSIRETSGIEVLRFCQKERADKRMQIIVISGGSDAEIMRALAEGSNGFLKKPFRPEALKEVIEEVFLIGA